MYFIGLDLSYRTVGLAILSSRSLKYDSHEVKDPKEKKLDQFEVNNEMIGWIFNNLNGYLKKEHILIIEDVYYGFDLEYVKKAGRIQGAVTQRYYELTKQKPIYRGALSARKNLEVRTHGSKAEVQLYVVDKFELGKVDDDIRVKLNKLVQEYREKKISKYALDKETNKLSTKIRKQTGIDDHVADAIVLALSEKVVKNNG